MDLRKRSAAWILTVIIMIGLLMPSDAYVADLNAYPRPPSATAPYGDADSLIPDTVLPHEDTPSLPTEERPSSEDLLPPEGPALDEGQAPLPPSVLPLEDPRTPVEDPIDPDFSVDITTSGLPIHYENTIHYIVDPE